MKGQYLPHTIESKWQKKWFDKGIYKAPDKSDKENYFLLVEFPYPSGAHLHVGHARSYCALDAVARMLRMKGYNVMYPMGWDAFGLPAENYAIKTGIHPSITVAENIKTAKEQAISWGLSFDWDREINTTDPKYYKWTQWIFLQLLKEGLAYQDEIPVNWCPSCKTNLANEEVINGNCERCGHETERRVQKQWLLKITEYADKLLEGLEDVDYRNDIKTQQINWIGRKEGVEIEYGVEGMEEKIKVFTTRPDTNYGATFIVLAPEHSLATKIATEEYDKEVQKYLKEAAKRSELERISETKDKTGAFTGRYVVNKLNGEKLPVYIGDFVLGHVGTGALVGVPGHDKRDFEFAKKFDLPVKRVVVGPHEEVGEITGIDQVFEGEGKSVNSVLINGLETPVAITKIVDHIEKEGFGKSSVTYHLRDWVFSRQHYWGEPIPVVHCEKCGVVPVAEKDLPVELPHVEKYEPTDTGESPLGAVEDWVNTKCPTCKGDAKRETDTMPNWAGSSWYYLRYIDPNNDKAFADPKLLEKWLPVTWYNGGMEHVTLHLLYSRFWHRFLYDQGLVPSKEPYAKRSAHGVILGPDGLRMSKSRGNVINPDDVIEAYGADTLRMYIMFIGPFEQTAAWQADSLMGVRRFLSRAWVLSKDVIESGKKESSEEVQRIINKLIKRIEGDLQDMKFNTVVSGLMEGVNELYKHKDGIGVDSIKLLAQVLAPTAPHLAEEIWDVLDEGFSVHTSVWPEVDTSKLVDDVIKIGVQVNGKFKGTVDVPSDKVGDEAHVHQSVISALNLREKHDISDDDKFIYVQGRIINFIKK